MSQPQQIKKQQKPKQDHTQLTQKEQAQIQIKEQKAELKKQLQKKEEQKPRQPQIHNVIDEVKKAQQTIHTEQEKTAEQHKDESQKEKQMDNKQREVLQQNQKQINQQKKPEENQIKQKEVKQEKKEELHKQEDKINKPETVEINGQKKQFNKFFDLLNKYFQSIKPEQKQRTSHNFNLNLNYDSSPLENPLQFKIKLLVGQKEITKIQTQYEERKINVQEGQHLIIEVQTKKGELIEQLIEARVKQNKLNFNGIGLKTNTDQNNLYIGLYLKNSLSLQKIQQIFDQKGSQNGSKIELSGKFGLGNEGKSKPEDRKLIKCISKGFQLNLKAQGSPKFINRFRKNIQRQHPQSTLYSLISLTKGTEIKLKLKKIEDINVLFGKLGILQAVKETPSIKTFIHDILTELFEDGNPENFDLFNLLQTILQTSESQKIRITKLTPTILISASLNQRKDMKNIIKK